MSEASQLWDEHAFPYLLIAKTSFLKHNSFRRRKMKPSKIKLFSQSVLIIILVLFLGNCGQSSQKLSSKKYKEGFSLKHPSNWHAQILDKTYIWISAKDDKNSPFIFVYPFFLEKTSSSLTSIQNNLTKLSGYFKDVTIKKKGANKERSR